MIKRNRWDVRRRSDLYALIAEEIVMVAVILGVGALFVGVVT